ncbi:MAG: N-acetylneuraminate synthase [Alicyclobacillus sp.]|uniref:N-acetylneuraminate synthase n=1 Tax=Alicyclobacillus herbarius TaxID=122960 RepID=UPI0004042373|nr:N-acetylneuraminate synthase [Alicyclobacillus herbarius]MCL6446062.1 N-acetylneuraminate synthase [Alicyclobacillus sp.]
MDLSRTFVVAEIGVNHNGSLDLAKQLVDAAASAGADAVKFQTFRADQLLRTDAPKPEYQRHTTDIDESQYDMLRRFQLSAEAHQELYDYCKKRHLEFLSTPFDRDSADLLVNELGVSIVKISSGDVTNAPLLLHIAQTRRQVILSTGMCTLGEVEQALAVLAFGFTKPCGCRPSLHDMRLAYSSEVGQKALADHVILLHTTSEYPAPYQDVNLRAMDTLRQAFQLPVGLSDHTSGIAVSIAAVARGAAVIERHLTLDRGMEGPDHRASLEPDELQSMIQAIRQVEQALGSPVKRPTVVESENAQWVRRSIVAARPIQMGEVFHEDNLAVKRPGTGLSPVYYWDVLGKRAGRDFKKDEIIQ